MRPCKMGHINLDNLMSTKAELIEQISRLKEDQAELITFMKEVIKESTTNESEGIDITYKWLVLAVGPALIVIVGVVLGFVFRRSLKRFDEYSDTVKEYGNIVKEHTKMFNEEIRGVIEKWLESEVSIKETLVELKYNRVKLDVHQEIIESHEQRLDKLEKTN